MALALATVACTLQPAPPRAESLTLIISVAIGEVEASYAEAHAAHRRVCPTCPPVEIRPAETASVATVDFAGRHRNPLLRYDRERMLRAEARHGKSAVVGIFAHELGHSYAAHRGTASRCGAGPTAEQVAACRREELSADAYAGCMLTLLGRDVAPFQAWLASTVEGVVHPDGAERARAAGFGAAQCEALR
jgi:hypothetical protein